MRVLIRKTIIVLKYIFFQNNLKRVGFGIMERVEDKWIRWSPLSKTHLMAGRQTLISLGRDTEVGEM